MLATIASLERPNAEPSSTDLVSTAANKTGLAFGAKPFVKRKIHTVDR